MELSLGTGSRKIAGPPFLLSTTRERVSRSDVVRLRPRVYQSTEIPLLTFQVFPCGAGQKFGSPSR